MLSYLPSAEAVLAEWALNFATKLTAAPATYGVTAPQALVMQTAYDEFKTAYAAAINPATRTRSAIEAKNIKKAAMIGEVRPLAMQIKLNDSVANADKIELGLTLSAGTLTPVQAPSTPPIIMIISATPRQQSLRVVDSATPQSRAKPRGATGLQLFGKAATGGPVSADDCKFVGFITRQPFVVNWQAADVGKTAFYYGRWQNAKGEVGPWSLVASFTIAG
jgi:hypothetical protein